MNSTILSEIGADLEISPMYLLLAGMKLKNMINKCDICALYQ